jgi:DNA-binding NarL/FixJ family response regulator
MMKLHAAPRLSLRGYDNALLCPGRRTPEPFAESELFAPGFPADLITNRQMEVFKLLGLGFSHGQIAQKLNVSVNTVRTFCLRIRKKLKLSNARKLLREAVLWRHRQILK